MMGTEAAKKEMKMDEEKRGAQMKTRNEECFPDSEVEYDWTPEITLTHRWNMKKYILTVTTHNYLANTDPPHKYNQKKQLKFDKPIIRFSRKNGADVDNHLDLTEEEWHSLAENFDQVGDHFIARNKFHIQLGNPNGYLFLKASFMTLGGNKGVIQFANLNRHYIPETSIHPQFSKKNVTLCSGEWNKLAKYRRQISDCLDLYKEQIINEQIFRAGTDDEGVDEVEQCAPISKMMKKNIKKLRLDFKAEKDDLKRKRDEAFRENEEDCSKIDTHDDDVADEDRIM